jgi:ABC-type antimicrobial peptide transport system permease subunit
MLTAPKLALRNLSYHVRGNLAVLLGVAVGSAVLTGALLVGDSLRGSLRARVERQLGGTDSVALFPRPVRVELADGLPGQIKPVLLLPGSIEVGKGNDPGAPYVGHITVLGIDERFALTGVAEADLGGTTPGENRPRIVLSHRVAEKLGVSAGAEVRLDVERFSEIPRATLLSKRSLDDSGASRAFVVAAVLPPDAPENDFNLTPNPGAPLNVFVPLGVLSDLVQKQGPRDRATYPVKITALLASGAPVADLDAALKAKLTAADFGLRVRVPELQVKGEPPRDWGYLSVETDQLVMTDSTAEAIEAVATKLRMRPERTIVYLVTSIEHDGKEIPYSLVAGLNPAAEPPLGPFRTLKGVFPKDGEIVLTTWPESPLGGLPEDGSIKLNLEYFNPEVEGTGKVEHRALTFRGYLPLEGSAGDPNLTPPVKGMTEKGTKPQNWDRPPQLTTSEVGKKIRAGDIHDRYVDRYAYTPKAYMTLATAKDLFASRYGSITSVRIAPTSRKEKESPTAAAKRLSDALGTDLDPRSAGLVFDPIRDRLLGASKGGTDFGMLFLGFSCFLIASALMLVGLLFRLSLDRRAKEIGLLLATGYSVKAVRGLLLTEGLILAVIGAAIGLGAGVLYNRLLLNVLLDLWPDTEVRGYLKPHESPLSFALGFGLTVVMSFVALWWGCRGLVKVPPPALLRGETASALTTVTAPSPWLKGLAPAALVIGIGLILAGGSVDNPDYRAMTFFGGGGLLLTAALAAALLWMRRTRHRTVGGRGLPALAQLGTRNAARNPGRSLLTAALLAAAAFLLVAVESFRRQPDKEFLEKTGGSGGFNLIAEVDVPVYQSFESGPGRDDLNSRLLSAFGGTDTDPRYPAALEALGGMEVDALRLRGGDDASCANLFQATRPRVLGVPQSLITGEKRFKFYETLAKTPEEKANPWRLLENPSKSGAVPVFCEQNTAQWMLKKGVGDEFTMPGDDGKDVVFRIVGTLADSPFQSELIVSDEEFARVFPKQTGYRVFLIRTAPEKQSAVAQALEIGFRANGLIATPTRDRVASYQAVIGAYLSTFQLLGGFGLLLGVLGLAVVILRAVWERMGELALLRAVGYRTRMIQFLVLVENALLLFLGLTSGVLAALASVAPHVASGAAVPWDRLAVMLGLVLVAGLVVASAATAGILRVPVIPALRRE